MIFFHLSVYTPQDIIPNTFDKTVSWPSAYRSSEHLLSLIFLYFYYSRNLSKRQCAKHQCTICVFCAVRVCVCFFVFVCVYLNLDMVFLHVLRRKICKNSGLRNYASIKI